MKKFEIFTAETVSGHLWVIGYCRVRKSPFYAGFGTVSQSDSPHQLLKER